MLLERCLVVEMNVQRAEGSGSGISMPRHGHPERCLDPRLQDVEQHPKPEAEKILDMRGMVNTPYIPPK